MNPSQIAAIKQIIKDIKIEKQDLQTLRNTCNIQIANINARIDVINADILTLKEGIADEP